MSGIARSATKDLVFFSSRRRHTRYWRDWSSDVCSSDLGVLVADRLVRSMWRHAIFTGPDQWRTVALILAVLWIVIGAVAALAVLGPPNAEDREKDRKSTRLNSSHANISYAVFCLKKKKTHF